VLVLRNVLAGNSELDCCGVGENREELNLSAIDPSLNCSLLELLGRGGSHVDGLLVTLRIHFQLA
jgi:hypothetical protein